MDADLEKKLTDIGIPKSKIDDIAKKKKYIERIKYVLEQGNITTADKETGNLIILVAEKVNPAFNHRIPLLLKYVNSKEITSSHQLDACVEYLRKKGDEELNEEDFKKQCGIGVKITEEDIKKEADEIMKKYIDQIKNERYKFPSVKILYDVKSKFSFVDPKLCKKVIDEEIDKLLGGKNENELKEEKMRKEFEDLKKKSKDKKSFTEEDKKRLSELKEELKKFDEALQKKKEELSSQNPEEEKSEKDKLSTLMARDMRSALNTTELIKKHLEVTGGKIMTRFPPEPNGYLHLGHAKAMRFCFTSASNAGGNCYLRLDDTNPEKETKEYIDSIKENCEWLGYHPWKVTYASDYFDDLYNIAVKLIKKGLAYVDNLSKQEISEYREKKIDSPYRNRTVEENLKLFEMMRQGRFEEKECCLRMKIDMKHNNPCMRDPVAYRIKYVPHPHAGDKWCIYPTYDFTHCLNDSLENITHSLCTLEFEIRRDSYYWLLEAAEMYRPFVWEYSRLNVTHIVVSKRKLLQLVTSHTVNGWDDPRMPTINGLRRRGYTADAINNFVDTIGVTRRGNENIISIKLLENAVKSDLDKKAPRTMAVIEPIKVNIVNLKEDLSIDTPLFPKLKESGGVRKVNLTKNIFIERIDFKEEDDKDFNGLTPNQEVGLKYAGVLKLEEIKKNKEGVVTELLCSYSNENKKTKGRIHWISDKDYVNAELRLYDYLFKSDDPFHSNEEGVSHDPMDDVNPDNLVIKYHALVNRDLCEKVKPYDHFQFERLGYFVCDPDSECDKGRYVFNLTVDLGDGKITAIKKLKEN
jgi:glutaminyl-tRNA synthetase